MGIDIENFKNKNHKGEKHGKPNEIKGFSIIISPRDVRKYDIFEKKVLLKQLTIVM